MSGDDTLVRPHWHEICLRRPLRPFPHPLPMATGLELTLLLLAASVFAVVLFRSANLPPMLGYLAVGIAIGPHALGLVADTQDTGALALNYA